MPYEAEHACRLASPGDFTSFRSKTSGSARLILGKRKDGDWEVQAIRYPKESWDVERAKRSCSDHEGWFEPAVRVAEHARREDLQEWDEAKDGALPYEAVEIFKQIEQEVRVYARRLRGVEIFSAGKWNGDVYTEQDIDGMVSAYYTLGPSGSGEVIPPLKLGHAEQQKFFGQQDGAPALGWVDGPRRTGKKLVGDFTDVPDALHGLIRERKYRKVSAEVFWNYKDAEGRIYPRVLKAVSLLGADLPAVSGLKDLQTALLEDQGREVRTYEQEDLDVRTYELEIPTTDEGGGDVDVKETKEYKALAEELEREKTARVQAEERATKVEDAFAVKEFTLEVDNLIRAGKVLPHEKDSLIREYALLGAGVRKYGEAEINPRKQKLEDLQKRPKIVEFKATAEGEGGEGDDGGGKQESISELVASYMAKGMGHDEAMRTIREKHEEAWKAYVLRREVK